MQHSLAQWQLCLPPYGVEDGQALLFIASDPGYVVGGVAQPTFAAPQNAVVNAASFSSKALAPGEIFSIFGAGLPQSVASAKVTVNGEAAPVFFANGSQINSQRVQVRLAPRLRPDRVRRQRHFPG
jgi:hypothetical protein